MVFKFKNYIMFALFLIALPTGVRASQKEQAKQLLMTLSVIQQEYQLAFTGSKLTNSKEYEEALQFMKDALKQAKQLDQKETLRPLYLKIEQQATPDRLEADFVKVSKAISHAFHVESTVVFPPKPDLKKGGLLYRKQCASCHGVTGYGNGVAAKGLKPPPANFHDPDFLIHLNRQDIFNVLSVGIPNTAMPSFVHLPEKERILITSYVYDLAGGTVLESHRKWKKIKQKLLSLRGADVSLNSESIAQQVRTIYLSFEFVEPTLKAKNSQLLNRAEALFTQVGDRHFLEEHPQALGQLLNLVPLLDDALRSEENRLSVFLQSFVILLREGIEIILLLSLLISLVKKAGLPFVSSIYVGSGLAILLSLLLAYASTSLQSVGRREVIEGIAHLVAAAVLFLVSFYLLSQKETQKWLALVKKLAQEATHSYSAPLSLFFVAFLVVFREGVETVLFYQALYLSAPSHASSLLIGALIAFLLLLLLGVLVLNIGARLPFGQFFTLSGVLLQIMCISFLGKGLHAFQEAGLLSAHYGFAFWHFPWLGMYPSVEVFSGQLLLLIVALIGWRQERKRAAQKQLV